MIDFTLYPPTKSDAERLARYEHFEQIFEGDYASAFDKRSALVEPEEEIVYLEADWGALISKVSADMLFSEEPIVSGGDDQKQIDQLLKETGLFGVLAEAALPQSFRGDAVLLLEWDQVNRKPVVTEIPAYNYFAEVSQDNCKRVTEEALAWTREVGRQTYLRVDRHQAGQIQRECYRLGGKNQSWKMSKPGLLVHQHRCVPCELAEAYPGQTEPAPSARALTGLSRSALFFAPNMRHGSRYFGLSDYAGGLPSLFDSYNERISEVHRVLSKHADPKLMVPEGVLDKMGRVKAQDIGVIEIPLGVENPDIFKYLIWDGQLQAAFKEIDTLEALIFKFSETSPAIFGSDKAGSIESGRAMKFRFQRTLAKVSRKARIWDRLLKELIWQLQSLAAHFQMEISYPDGTSEVARAPTRYVDIAWQDGLPLDLSELIDIEERRVNSRLSSRNSSIRRLEQISEAKAAEELEKIRKEEEAYSGANVGAEPTNKLGFRQSSPGAAPQRA